MLNRDTLFSIASLVDTRTLGKLSNNIDIVSSFADDPYFWYIRTERLLGVQLLSRPIDWKSVYYELYEQHIESDAERMYQVYTSSLLSSPSAVLVCIELGYKPTASALLTASIDGDIETVVILLQQASVDPATQPRCLLSSHPEVIKLLLEDGRCDPRAYDELSLYSAVEAGRVEITRLLLADGRVRATEELLSLARERHYGQIEKLLLAYAERATTLQQV